MPVVIWKNGAILIYKAARYVVPAIIAAAGAAAGAVGSFVVRRWRKNRSRRYDR